MLFRPRPTRALFLGLALAACDEAAPPRPCAQEDNLRFVRARNAASQRPLVWPDAVAHPADPAPPPCLPVRIDHRDHPTLAAATLDAAAREAFGTWAAPDCSPLCFTLRTTDEALLAREPGFDPALPPNTSVLLVETSSKAWQERFGNLALSATLVTSELETGHILDADILVNAADYTFVDPPLTCTEPRHADLRSVLTHEVGHFLGLAHTSDPASTMFGAWAEPIDGRCETSKRTLADGDVDGVCTVYRAHCEDPDAR